jgi:hypothetical protein
MLGMFQRQAKLDALQTIAVFRSVFPDEWLIPHPNAQGLQPKVVKYADGKSGEIGVIQNGQIMALNPQPGQQSSETLDRLQRSARLSAGIPAEWGGESGSNIRTARRGESVMSNAVDPDIQEIQEIFASSMEAEIRRANRNPKGVLRRQANAVHPRYGWEGQRTSRLRSERCF